MKSILLLALGVLSSTAMAARPVARWDVVPHQRVDGVFTAGVVAFHEDGVKVEFSVNGKKTFVAENPTLNARTGVWEFTFPFAVATVPDGPVTLQAKAITRGKTPESYDLPELSLFANARKSFDVDSEVWADAVSGDDANEGSAAKPVKTLQAAFRKVAVGGRVYLKKGVYEPKGLGGKSRTYWTTIAAAPGVKRADVEIGPGRPGADKLKFQGVTLFCDFEGKYTTILGGENGATCCWVDDCRMINKKGRWAANSNAFGNRMRAYVTGGETTEMNNGPDGDLVRNHTVYKIASDVWTGSDRLVVNCRCWDIDPGSTGAHPDFYQSHAKAPGWVHDVILYNVSGYNCECQGLFGVRLRDSAFVNISIHTNRGMYSQWSDVMENVIFAHVTLVDQTWLWRGSSKGKGNYSPKDVRVFNCLFRQMGSFVPLADFCGELKVHHNAFYGKDRKGVSDSGALGDEAIYVPREFVDESSRHYAPRKSSPAMKHGIPLQCVPADVNGKPYPSGPRPCGAYAG
jgi:hypothetical protein